MHSLVFAKAAKAYMLPEDFRASAYMQTVRGDNTMKFEEYGLNNLLLNNIRKLGFEEPTPVQKECLPAVLAGRDLVAQSATGTGKTAVFGISIIQNIHPTQGKQALILTPTRELCVQVADTLSDFCKGMHVHIAQIYGGVSMQPQIENLRRADIVVGTPGRILDHIQNENLVFDRIKFLVLDEADKMFEMGFIDDVERIIKTVSSNRQTMLFSATLPESVVRIVQRHLKNPMHTRLKELLDKSQLRQEYYAITNKQKFSLLMHFLKNKTKGLALIFCATRIEVDTVTRNLRANGVHAMAIHGGLSQSKRLYALDELRKAKIDYLVATDVAARGLDIKNVTNIYNYDVPKTSDEYIHRIGRTARAGETGIAITLLTERDHDNFRSVLSNRSLEIEEGKVPEFEQVQFVRNSGRDSGRGGFRGRGGPRREGGFRRREGSDRSGRLSRDERRSMAEGTSSRQGHFGRQNFRNRRR